jgi:hypothetical protein
MGDTFGLETIVFSYCGVAMGIWGGNVKPKSIRMSINGRRLIRQPNTVNLRVAGVRTWRKGL